MRASVRDVRRRMREVLAAVRRGETVTLTYRGRVWGYLVSPEQGERQEVPITEDPAFGMWKDREDMRDVQAYVRRLRRPRFNMDTGERRRD